MSLNPFRRAWAAGALMLSGGLAAACCGADLPGVREITALRAEIAEHDRAYHGRAAPEISDADYDRLQQRLTQLEAQFPEAARSVPPLERIGDDRTGVLPTRRHRERMLSLDKVYTEPELRAFHARVAKANGGADVAYVVEPKYDGLAVSLTFENGRLVRALTRGNGTEGDDVTAHVLEIAGVSRWLRTEMPPRLIEIRGEVHVPFAEFARVNGEREAAGEPLFANPRNLAAGTLRQIDAREVEARGLQLVCFGVGACEPATALPATQHALAARFKEWGLPAVARQWTAKSFEQLLAAVEACHRAQADFGFPTDGAVIKVDALALQREIGVGEHTPRWAAAYKFAPERVETGVVAITLQVGRTGVLTPVAELAPVQLGGSTIARATLHNRDEIARKDIRVGDTVYVEKAGEIIPAIVGVNRAKRPAGATAFVWPSRCPECQAPLAGGDGEAALRCAGAACPAQLRRRIEHFASKECMAIEGLGPTMVETLVAKGWVRDVADLYRLERDALLTLERVGERSVDRLLASLERSKRAELWRVVCGLSLPGVGARGAKELARQHPSLEAIAAACPDYAPTIRRLAVAGVQPRVEAGGSARFAGKVFVLTGTLPSLTRAVATARIEAAGGRIAGGVTRTTHYVVAGKDPGAKLAAAEKYGVPVIGEAELLRMLED